MAAMKSVFVAIFCTSMILGATYASNEDVVVPEGGEEIVGQGDALIARRLEADRRIKEKAKAGLV